MLAEAASIATCFGLSCQIGERRVLVASGYRNLRGSYVRPVKQRPQIGCVLKAVGPLVVVDTGCRQKGIALIGRHRLLLHR